MLPAPPTLTTERIDAMLSVVAETCLVGVTEAGARLSAAADMADFERAGRTLSTVARNLRQTIVLKQRYDRELAALAAEVRRGAEAERKDAEREHGEATWRHRVRVRGHFERVLWDEYEDDDAQEIFDDVDERLGELSGDAIFLETPVETLITRLTHEFGIGARLATEPSADDGEAAGDEANGDEANGAPAEAEPEPAFAEEAEPAPRAAAPEVQAAAVLPLSDALPEPPPEPEPPPRPPDPYIPPWERLRPGQFFPGGSGY